MLPDHDNRRQLPVLLALGLTLATLIVFWRVQDLPFLLWDDQEYIVDNPHVSTGLSRENVLWALTTTYASYWHPLTWLSHMLDGELYGLDPRGHHFNSLLLHTVNTVLLFLVLRRMTGALWRSVFVAALFALHPLRAESVAWATERKDVLSALFWMLTMGAYVRYTERPGRWRYLQTLLCFALGLTAKPTLVPLPFVLLLLDYWPLGRLAPGAAAGHSGGGKAIPPGRPLRATIPRLFLEKAPFIALAAASSVVTFLAARQIGAVPGVTDFPLDERIANALVSYVKYIAKMFWPADLAFFYPHPRDALPVWQAAGALLLLAGVTGAVIQAGRRLPYLAVGWLWYLGTLVPVIGLVQVGAQGMADRFTYLPQIGLSLGLVWGICDLFAPAGPRGKAVLALAAAVVLLALGIATREELRYWRSNISLFERALAVTTGSYQVHHYLGIALSRKGRYDEAAAHFSEALRIKPAFFPSLYNLAFVAAQCGREEEALRHYAHALRLRPEDAAIHNNMGNIHARQGRFREAVRHFSAALRIDPGYRAAYNNLGSAYMREGRLQEAISSYREALRIDPDFKEARYNFDLAVEKLSRSDGFPRVRDYGRNHAPGETKKERP